MARGIDSGRNNTLKKIANKQMTEDAPRMLALELLMEHEDNEYLFGMQGIEHMIQGIQQNGFKGAIEVWDLKDGTFKIYSGHRRYRAVKQMGQTEIKCFVYDLPSTETEQRRALLGANLYGRNSINAEDPIHTARQIAYHRETLQIEGFSGDFRGELAREFGTSGSQIYKYESLLNLNEEVQEAVANREIQFAQASSMAVLNDEKQLIVKGAIEQLKEIQGEGNVTRKEVQKIVDFVKKSDDEELTKDVHSVVMAVTESERKSEEIEETVHREQLESQQEVKNIEVVKDESAIETNTSPEVIEDIEEVVEVQEEEIEVEVKVEEKHALNRSNEKESLKKINSAMERLEDVLTEYYSYAEEDKKVIFDKLTHLQDLINKEKKRLQEA